MATAFIQSERPSMPNELADCRAIIIPAERGEQDRQGDVPVSRERVTENPSTTATTTEENQPTR